MIGTQFGLSLMVNVKGRATLEKKGDEYFIADPFFRMFIERN